MAWWKGKAIIRDYLEEANKNVQSVEGSSEAALSELGQLHKYEQALQDFIRGSEALRYQLDID